MPELSSRLAEIIESATTSLDQFVIARASARGNLSVVTLSVAKGLKDGFVI